MTEPKIRFLNEDGKFFPKWETTFIGEIVERQEHPVKVDKEVEYREIGIRSHGKGIFHKDPVTGKELGNKRVFDIVPDCLVLNIVFAWERAVAKTTTDEVGMIASHRFPMYKPKDGILDLDYIVRYLISDKGKKILELASPGGAGRNRTLGQKAFMESELPLPCYEEQKKIAEFFDKIDDVISNVEKELEAYKRLKAGMLQKMFPRNGSRVPEVRFPGFTEDWEQRKVSDVANIVGGGTPSTNNSEYWDGDIDWYAPAEIGEQIYVENSERKITKLGLEKSSAKMLPADKTVLFTSRAGIGKTAILRRPACTNQGFQSMVLNDDTNPYFVFSMTDMIKDKAERVASGSTFAEISGKMLGNLEFMFPSKAEQDKIGAYFEQMDNLITLHQHEHEVWLSIKKGYIKKMFI